VNENILNLPFKRKEAALIFVYIHQPLAKKLRIQISFGSKEVGLWYHSSLKNFYTG
jgi:hypothetical protein